MFGKKVKDINNEKDIELMMSAIDNIMQGNYESIDTSVYDNQEFAEKLNELIHYFKKTNNNFVLRANDAMEAVGNNSYVKKMLDQVESQTVSISEMEESGRSMEESIGNIAEFMSGIKNNSHEIIEAVNNSTDNMNASIKVVNESSDKLKNINMQVQDFQEKIDKIGEIVDIVKKVAGQSNLLALNASIEAARAGEAGKGFAVVADQVRQLSSNTSESAEDIVKYVSELRESINALAKSMDETTVKLSQGNDMVEESLKDINSMGKQMENVSDMVDNAFADIDTQSEVTKEFTKQVADISESYRQLSQYCSETGTHIYKVGRMIDTLRSDMVRGFSEVTQQDWLKVFKIDHYVLMWRVYNNLSGFEHLRREQLNNPKTCKIGKWISAQTDVKLTSSEEFKKVISTHENIHKYATLSWDENEQGNQDGARKYFQDTYDAFYEYAKAIDNLKSYMKKIGYTEETNTVVYRN